MRIEAASGAVFLSFSVAALVRSNSPWALQVAEIAARETLSPVERLEIALHPCRFRYHAALCIRQRRGTDILGHLGNPVTVAVCGGLALGKPIGVLTLSWLAVRSDIAMRPPDRSWSLLAGGGLLARIGFTMALFIANLAFSQSLIDVAKLAILSASIVSAVAGLTLLAWLSSRGMSPPTARN